MRTFYIIVFLLILPLKLVYSYSEDVYYINITEDLNSFIGQEGFKNFDDLDIKKKIYYSLSANFSTESEELLNQNLFELKFIKDKNTFFYNDENTKVKIINKELKINILNNKNVKYKKTTQENCYLIEKINGNYAYGYPHYECYKPILFTTICENITIDYEKNQFNLSKEFYNDLFRISEYNLFIDKKRKLLFLIIKGGDSSSGYERMIIINDKKKIIEFNIRPF